jgi:hypothetical protein
MSGYTFYSSCWDCGDTDASYVYGEACDWCAAHEDRNPGHRTQIDDVPNEGD